MKKLPIIYEIKLYNQLPSTIKHPSANKKNVIQAEFKMIPPVDTDVILSWLIHN